jgi:Zn-dependent protease with chaperone function
MQVTRFALRNRAFRLASTAILLFTVYAVGTAQGQTVVRPGFNVFSIDQDVEIGKQSAAKVEQQLPMMTDGQISRYVSTLGAKLATRAPGAKFAYQFRVVNSSDINAFALPGGFIYINRGLLEAVRSEGELAGVMAHEISHVALRHPTNQASKAYLAQAGIGVLGGLLGGRSQSSTGQIVGAIGGFGLNSLFLKFSRSDESQADIVGSQIMARAGYDPLEMARFFNFLGQQAGGNRSAVATFLSDHPSPANRETRVRQEAALLGALHPSALVGNLRSIQAQSRRLAPAPTTQLAQAVSPADAPISSGLSIERPSAQFRVFQQADGMFQVEQPDNWSAYVPSGGYGVTIVPRGGFETASTGRQNISYGFIVNHYVPFEGSVGASFVDPNGSLFGHSSLEEATSDLIRHVTQANPYLNRVAGSERGRTISGLPSFSVDLAGRSPSTGADERVTVVTQLLPDDHVVYMLLIVPAKDASALAPTFDRMVRSLRTNDSSVHN